FAAQKAPGGKICGHCPDGQPCRVVAARAQFKELQIVQHAAADAEVGCRNAYAPAVGRLKPFCEYKGEPLWIEEIAGQPPDQAGREQQAENGIAQAATGTEHKGLRIQLCLRRLPTATAESTAGILSVF